MPFFGGGGGNWQGPLVNTIGANITVNTGTISATGGGGGNWTAPAVSAIGGNLEINGGGTIYDTGDNAVLAIGINGTISLSNAQNAIVTITGGPVTLSASNFRQYQVTRWFVEQGAAPHALTLSPQFVQATGEAPYSATMTANAVDYIETVAINATQLLVTGIKYNYTLVAPADAWNPADVVGAAPTFSGGNLTVSATAGGSWSIVRSTIGHASGKYYSEHTLAANGTTGGNGDWAIGPVTKQAATNLGGDAFSIGYYPATGLTDANGTIGTIQTGVAGNIIRVAVDLTGKLVWYAANGGNWNNNPSANPATGVGGLAFAYMTPTAAGFFMAWGFEGATAVITSNFGGSAFGFAAPSGFANW